MISNGWYILISIPVTLFVYFPYISFLQLSCVHFLVLLAALYLILSFDLSADQVFRNSFILMLLNGVSAAGRAIIYLFMAIVLLIGPIYDIHHNILHLIEDTQEKEKRNDSQKITQFKHKLYHIIDSHVNNHLLRSVNPLCRVADDWVKYHSHRTTSDVCGSYSTRTHTVITKSGQLETFLYDLFNFGTFYAIQRALVFLLFFYSTFYLYHITQRYRKDMSFKNIFITSAVHQMDIMAREPTTDIEQSTEQKTNDVSDFIEDDEGRKLTAVPHRVFKRTLPLTPLERRQYILVNSYRYLGSEVIYMLMRLFKFVWILFLCVSICYFDIAIVEFLIDQNPQSKASISIWKKARLGIVSIYMLIALLFVFMEPVATRLHQQLLELFYPEVSERRARILMLTIKLQRKSFIKINRLNIFLRFNKVGNFWTAIRSFFEDTSLGDLLGRPSGHFCSICEKEAIIPTKALKCSTYSCNCVYCNECYEQIRFICLCCNKKYDETMVVHIHPHTANFSE